MSSNGSYKTPPAEPWLQPHINKFRIEFERGLETYWGNVETIVPASGASESDAIFVTEVDDGEVVVID